MGPLLAAHPRMYRTFLHFAVGTVASWALLGCSAAPQDVQETSSTPEEGLSILNQADSLKGCKGKASSSIPSSGDYYLTTFGTSKSDNGIMSCGSYTKTGSWYYAASRQRYGCGSHIKIEANGKCVIAQTDDYGPDVCVENAAGKPIIDASPLVSKHLFGASGAGYSDHLLVHVSEVSTSTPLGPCQAPPQQNCTPGTKKCNSAGTAVQTCKSDGSAYTTTETCSDGCSNGGCVVDNCNTAWSCDAWSSCDCSGKQTRTCTDDNNCGTSSGKPALSQSCDPCAGGSSTCSQCSGGCQYGSTGEHNDPCNGVPAETWRCVQSQKLGTTVSQVCRDSNNDGKYNWVSYHTEPADCAACCGDFTSACK